MARRGGDRERGGGGAVWRCDAADKGKSEESGEMRGRGKVAERGEEGRAPLDT